MFIQVKTIHARCLQVEICEEATIRNLKEKIESEHGKDYAAANQTLIYSGKMLDDNDTIRNCQINDKNFVMCVCPKVKLPTTPMSRSRSSVVSETSAPAVAQNPAAGCPQPGSEDPHCQSKSKEVQDVRSIDKHEVEPYYDQMIHKIMTMGFERQLVLKALQENNNHPERAVDYLLSDKDTPLSPAPVSTRESCTRKNVKVPTGGKPANKQEAEPEFEQKVNEIMDLGFERQLAVAALRENNYNPDRAAEYLFGEGVTDRQSEGPATKRAKDRLKEPRIRQMMSLVRMNCTLRGPLLDALEKSDPELKQWITRHPSHFDAMLDEVDAPPMPRSPLQMEGASAAPSEQSSYKLTAEDLKAIESLKLLSGCDEDSARDAYVGCGRNPNLAADFLMSQRTQREEFLMDL